MLVVESSNQWSRVPADRSTVSIDIYRLRVVVSASLILFSIDRIPVSSGYRMRDTTVHWSTHVKISLVFCLLKVIL